MSHPAFPHGNPLVQILRDRITKEAYLSFADYMDLVLYHPEYGYYSAGIASIGAAGDFFTSSSLGSDFGELMAEQMVQMWEILGQPKAFQIVEMGAGLGQCAKDVLTWISTKYPDFLNCLQYVIIEKSPGLIEQQKETLNLVIEQGVSVLWKTWEMIPECSIVGCFFSNELVDAFPVHQVVVQGGKLQEVYVTMEGDHLTERLGELSTDKILQYFGLIGIDLLSSFYPDLYRTEVNLAALDWLSQVNQKLEQGYLMTIDYGYSAHKYYNPQRYQGTLKCYFQHHHHHDPYVNLGHQDMTTHVNFTALERQGELLGLQEIGFTQQAVFLMALGLGERLMELSSGSFKIMDVLRRRDALHQLIDPTGLGGFGVLIQGKNLTDEQREILLQGFRMPQF